MELHLYREPSNSRCTPGKLFVGDQFECYTLEDVVREVKIPGQTAIPAGRYQVIINMSKRFKRELPLLLNVPGFEGVRIHPGNTDADTEGCILVGNTRDAEHVWGSKAAFKQLFSKIEKAGSFWITIHAHGETGVS